MMSDRSLPAPDRPWLVLFGLMLGVTVTNSFARFAYGLILPAMKTDMGWTYAQAGWLNTANALGYLAGAIVTMVLIGRMPVTRLFNFGLITTALSLLATGWGTGMEWQSFWRIAAGFFGAMSFSTAGVLTARLFADDARRSALAIALLFGTGGGMGILLAGAAVPLFLGRYGAEAWPTAWYVIGGLGAACVPWALWSAGKLHHPGTAAVASGRLPLRRFLPLTFGYAGFGLGYIVYLTFLSAWMTEQATGPVGIALVWVVLGLAISASPFLWRGVFARFDSGVPLGLVLIGIALGSALPVILPAGPAILISAVIFGLCVFMSPGAVTHFVRRNLPPEQWGAAVSLLTVVFALSQTVGPLGAGLLADRTGNLGDSLIAASLLLLTGAGCAFAQRPINTPPDVREAGAPVEPQPPTRVGPG